MCVSATFYQGGKNIILYTKEHIHYTPDVICARCALGSSGQRAKKWKRREPVPPEIKQSAFSIQHSAISKMRRLWFWKQLYCSPSMFNREESWRSCALKEICSESCRRFFNVKNGWWISGFNKPIPQYEVGGWVLCQEFFKTRMTGFCLALLSMAFSLIAW